MIAGQPLLPQGLSQMQYQIPQTLMLMNLFLFAFNLIPAFPMDGGRILRSCLAMFTDHATATKVAGILGQVVAIAFAVTGLVLGQVSLLVIGIFVFVAARVELAQAKRFPSGS
jgi:stage IV sporulation protein FB